MITVIYANTEHKRGAQPELYNPRPIRQLLWIFLNLDGEILIWNMKKWLKAYTLNACA